MKIKKNIKLLLCLNLSLIITNIYKPKLNVYAFDKNNISLETLMDNHFDMFVEQYNHAHEDKLLARSIKDSKLLSYPSNTYFYDFDIGYALINKDFEIIKIANEDLSYENELLSKDEVVYDGRNFYYVDNNIKYEFESIYEDTYLTGTDSMTSSSNVIAYDGQLKSGDGQIYDIDLYVKSRYPEYQFSKSNYIRNYRLVYQNDTSYYIGSDGHTEGNCVLNSAYSMLINMARNSWNEKYYTKEYYVDLFNNNAIYNDSIYRDVISEGGQINNGYRIGEDNNGKKRLSFMPHLYTQIRDDAISKYNYDIHTGMNSSDIINIVNDVQGWYGYSSTFKETTSNDDIAYLVDSHIPSVISTTSATYGNHAMSVYGYYVISKTNTWWIFSSTDYKYFYCVDDGWAYKSNNAKCKGKNIYYDANVNNNYKFICADKASLILSLC